MNRKERRALNAINKAEITALPELLTPIPAEDIPDYWSPKPIKAWKSRKYLVQLYEEENTIPNLMRLSINRSRRINNQWQDGISWEELQGIKREVGFGDWYAVEIYPRDRDVINVSNIRHLWLMPDPLPIGWIKGVKE